MAVLSSCRQPYELPNSPDGQSHRPLPPPPIEPGKRDYHWTVDTLHGAEMSAIWGDSANNIYIVGDWGDVSNGSIYHYDGKKWKGISFQSSSGGVRYPYPDLSAIYGFSNSDIYAVGDYGAFNGNPPTNILHYGSIIHYDGTQWRDVSIDKKETFMRDIWGANSIDIWACGQMGALYHFTGSDWKRIPWDTTIDLMRVKGFASNDVFMTAYKNLSHPDTLGSYRDYIFHWNGLAWTMLDSTEEAHNEIKFGLFLLPLDHHTLYSSWSGVWHSTNGILWENDFLSDGPMSLGGSSTKNIFAIGFDYCILHWNGVDWKEVPSLIAGSGYYNDVWTNNNETFIITNHYQETYIMHGK